MSSGNKNKIFGYSFSCSSKGTLDEISRYQDNALKPAFKELIGEKYYTLLTQFWNMDIEQQREELVKNDKDLVLAHVKCLFDLDSEPMTLSYVLPNLDGILYEKPEASKHIFKLIEENERKMNIIEK